VASDSQPIARRFAAALDAEDYLAASQFLAEQCVYHLGNATIAGRDAIIGSYRANGESAKRRFESFEYVSDVETTGASDASITFTDRLRSGDHSHEFRCRQHLRIGLGGLVEEIVHEELPGERQRLEDFEDHLHSL
jgi:hypothetical protein